MAKYRPTSCSILVKKPNNDKITIDKTTIANNKIIFKITADMINEFSELGTHYIQIRLYDEHDHVLTIPAVKMEIKPLIDSPAVTDEGKTDEDTAGEGSDTNIDDDYGNDFSNKIYNIRNWNPHEIIRAFDLNKMEEAIDYLVKYENLVYLTEEEYAKLQTIDINTLYVIYENEA